jgi:hypothetical protein
MNWNRALVVLPKAVSACFGQGLAASDLQAHCGSHMETKCELKAWQLNPTLPRPQFLSNSLTLAI